MRAALVETIHFVGLINMCLALSKAISRVLLVCGASLYLRNYSAI